MTILPIMAPPQVAWLPGEQPSQSKIPGADARCWPFARPAPGGAQSSTASPISVGAAVVSGGFGGDALPVREHIA